MAGAAPVPQQRGRNQRRALDAALNLVPFIDLLSCCIAFLLITAAWTQLARLSVRPSPRGAAPDEAPPSSAPQAPTLTIGEEGYTLERAGDSRTIPRRAGDYDLPALAAALGDAKAALPAEESLVLRASDHVPYRELVRAMDAVLSAHFPQISVGDG